MPGSANQAGMCWQPTNGMRLPPPNRGHFEEEIHSQCFQTDQISSHCTKMCKQGKAKERTTNDRRGQSRVSVWSQLALIDSTAIRLVLRNS